MTVEETLARLKALYFQTTEATISEAFDEAIDLLKSLPTEADRERAAVYMEGLAEMRQEWKGGFAGKGRGRATPKRRPR